MEKPTLISEAVFIGFATLLAYLGLYLYRFVYFAHFGIPTWIIELDTPSIIASNFIFLIGLLIILISADIIYSLIKSKLGNLKPDTSAFAILAIYYAVWLIMRTFLYGFSVQGIIKISLVVLFLALVFWLRRYFPVSENTTKEGVWSELFISRIFRDVFGRSQFGLLSVLFIVLYLAIVVDLGNAAALNQKVFTMIHRGNQSLVVLGVHNHNYLVMKPLENGVLKNKVVFLSLEDLKGHEIEANILTFEIEKAL
jgi:hypothetical protein